MKREGERRWGWAMSTVGSVEWWKWSAGAGKTSVLPLLYHPPFSNKREEREGARASKRVDEWV